MAERPDYLIRFQAPEIPDSSATERYFQLSRDKRWFSNRGPCQELLEERMAADLGGGVSVVPVSNATAGLMVAIRALVGFPHERRHIIVPSYTFIATISAILWAGYEPIFADVDPAGWHLSVESVNAAIASHPDSVALVMACSTFGTPHPPETLAQLRAAADAIGAPLLVDAAAGYGSARPDGRRPSCEGDLDVYSFHATKPFAIGEGGLVVATDPRLAARVASLANFGFGRDRSVATDIGINAKLDEWHCATALAVLDAFPAILASRSIRAQRVKAALAAYGFASQQGGALASNQFVAVLAPTPGIRDRCLELAAERRIEVRAYYHEPLHLVPTLADYPHADDLVTSTDLAARALSLPLANDTTDLELDLVIEACTDAASGR
jgi:dTDP-4-amino-4,6-dideoxygalactose transaminase